MAKPKRSQSNNDLQRVITAAEKTEALSNAFMVVKRARFRLDQSGATLTDDQRLMLEAEYDATRDAYYQGLSDFVDATEPSVAVLLDTIKTETAALDALQVSQANSIKVLDAIAGIASLASKLLVLGMA